MIRNRAISVLNCVFVGWIAAATPGWGADRPVSALDVLNSSSVDRPGGWLSGVVEVYALSDTSRASIRMGRTISAAEPGTTSGGSFQAWSLVASAPLNKSEDKTALATLDGFVNSSKLEGRYSRLSAPGKRDAAAANSDPLLDEICDRASAQFVDTTSGKSSDFVCDKERVKQYARDRYEEYVLIFWDPARVKHLWGASAALGYEVFKFIDSQTVTKRKNEKYPWSAGAYYGVLPPRTNTLLLLGIEFQNGYKGNDPQTLCPAPTGAGVVTCETGSIEPPKEDDKELLSFEVRREAKRFGISLKLSFDLEKDVFGADLPMYFIRDREKKLSAGVRLGWRDDTDDFILGVFVGKSFSLVPM